MLATMVASTLGALHGSHADQEHRSLPHRRHHLNKRQMRSSQPGGISAGPGDDPGRQDAFSLGSNNYNQLVGNSIAAAASGGQAGIASMWAGYVPSAGNPYGLYYSGNGRGSVTRGKANEGVSGPPGDVPNSGAPPSKEPPNDQGRAIIQMMEQVGASL